MESHRRQSRKAYPNLIRATHAAEDQAEYEGTQKKVSKLTKPEREKLIASLEGEMKEAAKALDFERAAQLRDTILELKAEG